MRGGPRPERRAHDGILQNRKSLGVQGRSYMGSPYMLGRNLRVLRFLLFPFSPASRDVATSEMHIINNWLPGESFAPTRWLTAANGAVQVHASSPGLIESIYERLSR